jgi:hypothetical protein
MKLMSLKAVNRITPSRAAIVCAALLVVPAQAQTAPHLKECKPIVEACKVASFAFGAWKEGKGLEIDCYDPIVKNKPQPKNSAIALPQVDPSIVAACRANPT